MSSIHRMVERIDRELVAMDGRKPSLLLLGVLAWGPAIGAEPGTSFAEFEFQVPQYGNHGGSFRGVALPGDYLSLDAALDFREHRGGDVGMASLGVGMRLQQAGPMRIVLGVSVDAVGGAFGSEDSSQDDLRGINGVAAGAGVNLELAYRFGDRFELVGRGKRTTMDICPWVVTAGARYYAWWGVAIAVDVQNDVFGYRYGVGLRLDLGRH